jgi:hypothetical protein
VNIEQLTVRELKELAQFFSGFARHQDSQNKIDSFCLGQQVIIRTYSAGVWAGTLDQKIGDEVILKSARRMWQWKAKAGISLSAVVANGLDQQNSKVTESIDAVWLQAIEIIPLGVNASSVLGAPIANAE